MKTLNILMMMASLVLSTNSQAQNPSSLTVESSDIKFGVQLWSVRDLLAKDFKGTIESLAQMGFEGLEFAGVFGEFADNPSGLKRYLDDLGLTVSGAHVSFEQLSDDKIEDTLHFYRKLGANYLIIGWDTRAWNANEIDNFMADLNRAYSLVSAAGFEFGFHNHDKEFNTFKQSTYWDYIAQNSSPNMVLQLDVAWVKYAGKDPIHYVKTYQGRTLTSHYKVRTHQGTNQSPIIGENDYDWLKLFNAMQEFGGTKWVIVEQEEYPDGLSSLESVAKSKAGLDKLLAKQ